jgi:hypothetical protein
MVEEVDAVFFIEVQHDLRIGPRLEPVSSLLEPLAEAREVVDLSVDDHRNGVVFIGHGLGCLGSKIDDRQAPVPKHARAVAAQTVVVRATVHHRITHATNGLGIWPGLLIDSQQSRNAAHVSGPFLRNRRETDT